MGDRTISTCFCILRNQALQLNGGLLQPVNLDWIVSSNRWCLVDQFSL